MKKIEGIWTGGYRGSQRLCVHREYTSDRRRVLAVEEMGSIPFGDGTRLILSVTEAKRGERAINPPCNGYGTLISKCVYERRTGPHDNSALSAARRTRCDGY